MVLIFSIQTVTTVGGEIPGKKKSGKATVKSTKCYMLISGKNDEMCRLFDENLNRFCDEPPMVCERKIHPDFAKDFSFPDWEAVDSEKHLDLIANYIRARAPKNARCAEGDEQCQAEWREVKWQEYKPKLLERMRGGQVTLARAPVYIFNKERIVYRLVDAPCPSYRDKVGYFPQVPKLFATDKNTGKFDPDFTKIAPIGAIDVLLYKDEKEAYVTQWEIGPLLRLRIYIPSSTRCVFKYSFKKGAKK